MVLVQIHRAHCATSPWRTCTCVALLCTVNTLQVCDLEQAHQGPKVSDMLHYGDVAHMAPELVSEGHLTEVRQLCRGLRVPAKQDTGPARDVTWCDWARSGSAEAT